MVKLFRKTSKKPGLPPGTLIHTGEKKVEGVKISVIDYDETQIQEREAVSIEECLPFKEKPTVTWINVTGIHDVKIIEEFGTAFNIHPLLLEDIVHTDQRPKLEEFDESLFIILKMLSYDEANNELLSEQVSLILGSNFVISFQEREGDVFNPVRVRIKSSKGRIKKKGCDYLVYALIDAVVDHYFLVLEKYGEKVEILQEEVLSQPTPHTLEVIQGIKRDMIFLRKSVWPLREVINVLQRGESALISDNVIIYLRDVYDHTIQVIDNIEMLRDMISGTLDVYLSSVSNKMNEVMKVLTIVATIFIPLTFIAGIYGMNFKYMPELDWHWGYPIVLGVMVLLVGMMLIWFKRKRFL
jgi:magnesium transporter